MSTARFHGYMLLAVGLLGAALFLPQPQGTMLWRAVLDAGHAPLFGLIAILLLRAIAFRTTYGTQRAGIAAPQALRVRWRPYFETLALTVLLSAATEAAQIIGPRDADVVDFLRNIAGALAFLMLALAWDRPGPQSQLSRRSRAGLLIASAILLLAVASPVLSMSLALLQRNAAMPLLCDFESRWSRRLWSLQDAELHLTSPPEPWSGSGSDSGGAGDRPRPRIARIDFRPATYPGFTMLEPSPDWSAYETLAFDVFSQLDSTVTLVVRIDDVHAYQRYQDRFNRAVAVQPGVNQVRVSLSDVAAGPRDRVLDLTRVQRVILFAQRPENAFSLYLDDIRLQ